MGNICVCAVFCLCRVEIIFVPVVALLVLDNDMLPLVVAKHDPRRWSSSPRRSGQVVSRVPCLIDISD